MREELQSALKSRFRSALIRVRNTKRITQEEMAALLEISPRAYADLESGRSCCSAATLLMFLRLFCPGDHPFWRSCSRPSKRRTAPRARGFSAFGASQICCTVRGRHAFPAQFPWSAPNLTEQAKDGGFY